MSISYDFVISVYQEKFHFRILNKKYFKTLKIHCINFYSLETIFLMAGKKITITGKWPGIIFVDKKRSPWFESLNIFFSFLRTKMNATILKMTFVIYEIFKLIFSRASSGWSWTTKFRQNRNFFCLSRDKSIPRWLLIYSTGAYISPNLISFPLVLIFSFFAGAVPCGRKMQSRKRTANYRTLLRRVKSKAFL